MSPSTAEIVTQSGVVPGAEYLLEVSNVRKAFPGVLALDDVSFHLKRGHVHALMGENGAGKSTLMKIIAGIYTPDSGSFKLKGQEIKLTSPSTLPVRHRHDPSEPIDGPHDGCREHLDPPRASEQARLRAP
jgi:ABC-type glutathione transport system ATPase component